MDHLWERDRGVLLLPRRTRFLQLLGYAVLKEVSLSSRFFCLGDGWRVAFVETEETPPPLPPGRRVQSVARSYGVFSEPSSFFLFLP